jgi:L-iduronidase
MAHCDTGMNVITGERGAVLDYISAHRKALPYQMIDMEKEVIEYIREKHPRFKDLPFWNDEADPTWGWSQRYWWRAHPWYAAFVAQSLDAHNRLLVDSMGVNYGILVNDHGFLGDWYQRTLTAEYTNPDEDNQFWLFKKPVLSVMTMLALGEGSRFQVEGYASTRENVSVIPSRTQNGDVVVILANRPDFGVVHDGRNQNEDIPLHQKEKHDRQGASVKLSLKNLGIENPELMQVQLDALHGNAHGAWKDIGKPDIITTDVYRMIAANMDPVVVEEGLNLNGTNNETLHVVLPPSSVTMLVIRDKSRKQDFTAPEISGITEYIGYNGEMKNFISWQEVEGAIVRYDVYASYDNGKYQKVNPYPVFERGYLDVLPDNVEKAKYQIQVVY